MTARFPFLQAATRSGSQQIAAAVAIVFAGMLSTSVATYAQTAATSTASAATGASAPVGVNAGGAQFTVQPGQSLNDAAIAMTQSRDRAVLARAAKAIFDANPNAFMGHDPSRLRLGAVLNLPPVDATGAPVSAASAPAPASAASAPAAQATGSNTASATASAAAPAATAPGASAAAGAGASSSEAATSPTTGAAATQGASAPATPEGGSTPAAAAQPASGVSAPAASGTHSYIGSVQGSEPAATSSGAPAANAQVASQARPSSLQQLLALKNRVLMELQKHGIGKQPGTNENPAAATGTTQPSSAAPGAGAPAHAAPSAAPSVSPATGIPQEYLGAAAIAGAALVALLAGVTARRRRKATRAQEAASAEMAHEDVTPPVAAAPLAVAPSHEVPSAVKEESDESSHRLSAAATAAAAYETAASSPEVKSEAASRSEPETFHVASAEAALDAAATLGADALPRESLDPAREEARAAEVAQLALTAREQELTPDEAAADTRAAQRPLDETSLREPVVPQFAEPIKASDDESGARSKPFMLDLGPAPDSGQIEPTFEQPFVTAAPPIQSGHVEPAAQHEQPIEPLPAAAQTHADAEDEPEPHAPASLPLGAPPPLEPAMPDEFPREAMRALDSIDDFALPPRTEPSASAASAVSPPGSLATQPVVAPEITAQQAVSSHLPQSPAVADQIIAGTAGAAAVAGLGASRFGALKLDFDLELPPSPAQAVPSFSPDEIARIARNKLDLAAEYIELGDVVGARTLINEVIESNDADTRADARALLSTLAPLS
ncbi:FimV/HubP family polar landmark protein [Paraburkholderia phymatum]|uniref:Transmembrane protein n=1 Tax=Paraburkholderia phymatum (strain DSM 17167 / CIP 108236 / LMG 21445 / STM815) TaxID=391038 RepID=B2JQE5_PARP8|nr:FimV/HubP family polar landmark protein [Paraburkholderia phymatum]ACC73486.1 conserved hypothetical protein [Paraburkholderia phymatum STM815]